MRSLVLLAVAALAGATRADEAVLRDGQRVQGTLSLTADRRWQFLPTGKKEALPLTSIHHVRFPDGNATPLQAELVQRVTLSDGTVLTGVVLSLDARQLEMRTAWAERIAVPRTSLTTIQALARGDDPRRGAGDRAQDEIWLSDGDQVFGHLLDGDRRSVQMKGAFGTRSFRWTDVRGLFLSGRKPKSQEGERVKLWLDGGAGGEPDLLEGRIIAWDEKRCRLHHPDLGELEVEQRRIRRLTWAAKE